jgi:hypothetical protein
MENSAVLLKELGVAPSRIQNLSNVEEKRKKESLKISCINDDQHYHVFYKTWSASDYFSAENPTESIKEIFDPTLAMEDGTQFWIVDFASTKIDSFGWTYAKNFKDIEKGKSVASPDGFVLGMVRRRVWIRNHLKRQDPASSKYVIVSLPFPVY